MSVLYIPAFSCRKTRVTVLHIPPFCCREAQIAGLRFLRSPVGRHGWLLSTFLWFLVEEHGWLFSTSLLSPLGRQAGMLSTVLLSSVWRHKLLFSAFLLREDMGNCSPHSCDHLWEDKSGRSPCFYDLLRENAAWWLLSAFLLSPFGKTEGTILHMLTFFLVGKTQVIFLHIPSLFSGKALVTVLHVSTLNRWLFTIFQPFLVKNTGGCSPHLYHFLLENTGDCSLHSYVLLWEVTVTA